MTDFTPGCNTESGGRDYSAARTRESRVGERVRYDEHTGRISGGSWKDGVLLGYTVRWDDGYRDAPGAPFYSDEELEPAPDSRAAR